MERFWIVDVFTQDKYTGNQLAVVRDERRFSTETMQRIAREMNFSETAFVARAPRGGAWPLRIFTPHMELPFAGHPTVGSAWVLRHELGAAATDALHLEVTAGRIPITFDDHGAAWMVPPLPQLGEIHEPALLARALGLDISDIDQAYPVQTIRCPVPQTFIPLRSLAAIERARQSGLEGELEQAQIHGSLYMFTRETHSADATIHARHFAARFGVPEDPATGSAAGSLALYAAHHGYLAGLPLCACIEQGLEMGRPANIHVRAERGARGWRITVGGHVVVVAAGELR